VRLWKRELQKLANEFGLDITVSHLPPGTSKWNKIEHRLFSFISQNWRAKPLVSYRVIVELISATTTKTGLTVHCELDTGQYPSGIVVSDAEMDAINLKTCRVPRRVELHHLSERSSPTSRANLVTTLSGLIWFGERKIDLLAPRLFARSGSRSDSRSAQLGVLYDPARSQKRNPGRGHAGGPETGGHG
jgi:hypothetical protein